MRIICALQDAADKGEIEKDIPLKVAERLWKALWTEDKNTSDETIMQAEIDSLIPGGWEKWKYVDPFSSSTHVRVLFDPLGVKLF